MTAKAKKFKLKPKNYMSYVVIGAVLAVLVILYYTGNLKTSYTKMFHQIAYSILLAVSLNLVVGFLGELSLGVRNIAEIEINACLVVLVNTSNSVKYCSSILDGISKNTDLVKR